MTHEDYGIDEAGRAYLSRTKDLLVTIGVVTLGLVLILVAVKTWGTPS